MKEQLEDLREKIDQVDQKILDQLVERFKLSQSIKVYKKKENLNYRDSQRESIILEKVRTQTQGLKTQSKILSVFDKILEESLNFISSD